MRRKRLWFRRARDVRHVRRPQRRCARCLQNRQRIAQRRTVQRSQPAESGAAEKNRNSMAERSSVGRSPAKLSSTVSHGANSGGASPQPAPAPPAISQTIIAVDPKTQYLIHQASKVAKTRATVLIQGESGSGKDQLAQFIHFFGPAADQPYVKIDCAALPAELVESELFGYERGAFTGATAQKRGRIERAESGTLVLDEIAALSLSSQAKLLRVLEDRRYQRLGGMQDIEVNARILALTNVNLEEAVGQKNF